MSVGSVGSSAPVTEVQKPAPQPAAVKPPAEMPKDKVSISPQAQKAMDVDGDGDGH